MSLENDTIELRFDNIIAGTPIECTMMLLDATTVTVRYGASARLLAVVNTDYTITLDEVDDYHSFSLTPTASLITKINALIAGTPGETNTIWVKRTLGYLSDFEETDGFLRQKIADEFSRTLMRIQQVKFDLDYGIYFPYGEVLAGRTYLPTKAERLGKIMGFDSITGLPKLSGNIDTINTVVADAVAAKDIAVANAALTAADRLQTGLDRVQTGADRVQTGLDRAAVAADKITVAADKGIVAADKATTLGYKNAADADAVATAADRVQTGLDRTQTGLDRVQTAADRVQTGLDRVATAADRVVVANDKATVASDKAAAQSAAAAAQSAAAEGLYNEIVTITFAQSPYVPLLAEEGYLYKFDTSGGNIVVNLSSLAAYGEDMKFAFVKTTADANTVTINRGGTDTIEGATSRILTSQYEINVLLGDFATGLWLKDIHASGIADGSVTFAKIQNIATASLIGRSTAGTGVPESITAGSGIEIAASTIRLKDGDVANVKLANMAAGTVKANTTGGAAAPSDVTINTTFKTALGLVKADVGLGNADNTSDANKPVSTATQTALNLKADLASPALTGNPTAPTQTLGDNSTKLATTAFVLANSAGWKTVPKNSDESTLSDTTYNDDAALAFPVEANKKYAWRARIVYLSVGTGGIKTQWTGPASPNKNIYYDHELMGASPTKYTSFSTPAYNQGGVQAGLIVDVEGILDNGANAGNVKLQWAQASSIASNTTVCKGSYIEYKEIA